VRILYVSQYFPPEIGAPSVRVHELARMWVEQGHEVTVLTGFPNHPTGIVHRQYRGKLRRLTMRESIDGIDVVRTWLLPLPNRKASERVLNYASFCVSAALRGMFLKKYDVVIATSPQLLVGLAGWFIARLSGAKFVFEVRDLWPESLIGTGVSDTSSMLYRSLLKISTTLYEHADHVVAVTPAFKKYMVKEFGCSPAKISVVPNGVDVEWFEEARKSYVPHRGKKFVVSFIGTIGNAHGVETILRAAEMLRESHSDVVFRIVGEGAERQRIQTLIEHGDLPNVQLMPQQARANVPGLIWDSDVCLVLLKGAEIFKTVIPTKLLEFMACGRAVVLGVEGQALEILREAKAGLAIPPEDAEALASAVLSLKAYPEWREKFGENGRRYIERELSRRRTATEYERILMNVAGDKAVQQSETRKKAAAAGQHLGASLVEEVTTHVLE
jgi:colanic acid biosynthesis glycosyl transferase WcaI